MQAGGELAPGPDRARRASAARGRWPCLPLPHDSLMGTPQKCSMAVRNPFM